MKLNEHTSIRKPIIILRMKYIPFIDTTAIVRLNSFLKERHKQHNLVFLADVNEKVQEKLFKDEEFTELIKHSGLPDEPTIFPKTKDALQWIEDKYLPKN